MLGMLDLEITVLVFCFFTLNLPAAGEHISVSCLHVLISSLQNEIFNELNNKIVLLASSSFSYTENQIR